MQYFIPIPSGYFLLPILCEVVHLLFTRIFFSFFVACAKSPTAKVPARILVRSVSKDALPRKDVLLWDYKYKI